MQEFLQNWGNYPYIECKRKHKRKNKPNGPELELPESTQKSELYRQMNRFKLHFLQCLSHTMLEYWGNRDVASFQFVKDQALRLSKIKFQQDMNDRLVRQGHKYTMQYSIPKEWRAKFKQSIDRLRKANASQLTNMNKKKTKCANNKQFIDKIQISRVNVDENLLLPSSSINFNNYQEQNSIFITSMQENQKSCEPSSNSLQQQPPSDVQIPQQPKDKKQHNLQLLRQSNRGSSFCCSHYPMLLYIIICSVCRFQWQIQRTHPTRRRCHQSQPDSGWSNIDKIEFGYYQNMSPLEQKINLVQPEHRVYDAVSKITWSFDCMNLLL